MNLTPKQISLQQGLQENGLRDLPKRYDPKSGEIWITALAMVRRSTGIEDYVYVVNEKADGVPVVKKDYGVCSAIAEIKAIYPIERLEKRFVPSLRTDKQIFDFLVKRSYDADMVSKKLSKEDKTPEQIEADRSEIRRLVNEAAIKNARETIEEERRCKNIGNINKDDDGE